MHTRAPITLCIVGMSLALATPDPTLAQDPGEVMQATEQHPLARTWILNVEKSDDAQERMQQAQSRSGPGDAGGRRRGARPQGQRRNPGSGGRRPGARGPGQNPEAMATNRVVQQRIMRAGSRMRIVLSDSTAAIGSDDLAPWLFPTDESKRNHQEGIELTGKLDGDKLEIETKTEGGLRIRETYELKDDGAVLEVSVSFENSNNMRVRFKRVYDVEDTTGGGL